MSVQVFLQGKLAGIEDFVCAPAASGEPAHDKLVRGRALWLSLLSEAVPRALLEELGLARVLLGLSGGSEFLIVLPQESLGAAEALLHGVAEAVSNMGGRRIRLVWGSTENLGDWSIVRKRLAESLWIRAHTAPPQSLDEFVPGNAQAGATEEAYFESLASGIRQAKEISWSPEDPARIGLGEGKLRWPIGNDPFQITLPRHAALDDAGAEPASAELLASRALGRQAWGILRADVDGFGVRLRRAASIEEHLQLSHMFRQFFAGELELQCSMADFWRRATILSTGDDDFAVYGSWDALLMLAREMQRLFQRMVDANLKDLPGPEGKTITMALEVASDPTAPFGAVYEAAGRSLEAAKCADKDAFHVFGRTVEWRQLQHIGDLKEMMLRMVRQFGCPPKFLEELSSFYHDKPASGRPDRPWRYHRRLAVVLGEHKDRELQRLRTALISDIVGKSPSHVKLRPAGLVAVEWARMLAPSGASAE